MPLISEGAKCWMLVFYPVYMRLKIGNSTMILVDFYVLIKVTTQKYATTVLMISIMPKASLTAKPPVHFADKTAA